MILQRSAKSYFLVFYTKIRPGHLGISAMLLTVLLWSGFALSIRATSTSSLATADVAFFRGIIPVIIFLPFVKSRISSIYRAGLLRVAIIAIGSGLPFFYLAVAGGAKTSATHVGILIAGTVPVFVMCLSWVCYGAVPLKKSIFAIFIILVGVVLTLFMQGGVDKISVYGVFLLILSSILWSISTILIKETKLDPVSSGIVISFSTVISLVFLIFIGIVETNFGKFSFEEAMPFILTQGIGVGVLANLSYAYAISKIGPGRSSTIGALAPALTALLAVPLLGESLTFLTVLAVVIIFTGVVMANKS